MNEQQLLEIVEAADVSTLSREEQARAFVKGTNSIYSLMNDTVCSVIMGQVRKSDIEQAITATYYRITLLLRGISILDDPAHFQIANSVARTVFELVLDLKALRADPSLAARFFTFSRVFKFKKAEQLFNFLNENPSIDLAPHQSAINFTSDAQRRNEVEQLCIQHWGTEKSGKPKCPDHWSGKSIADRARDAGPEFSEIYRSQYFLQCQYVHAGPAGIQDLSQDALICSFGITHRLVQLLAAKATELAGDTFHLFGTNLDLRENLRKASAAAGFYAVEAVLLKHKNVQPNREG